MGLSCVFGRLERIDWMAQAEQLKQQTLATLSDRDQQLRQLNAMLEEARTHKPKLEQEHYQREVGVWTHALSQCFQTFLDHYLLKWTKLSTWVLVRGCGHEL